MEPFGGRACIGGMRRTITLTTALFLLLAAPAAAKEITAARICGSDGCSQVMDRATLAVLPEGGDPTDPPAGAAPFYKMTLDIRADDATDSFTVLVVPSRNLMRGSEGTWMPMGGEPARLFRQIAARHEAFPAAQLPGVRPAGAPPKASPDADGPGWQGWASALVAGLAVLIAAWYARRRRPPHPAA
jgi:hypothetical protein